jgi:hypothetical protein
MEILACICKGKESRIFENCVCEGKNGQREQYEKIVFLEPSKLDDKRRNAEKEPASESTIIFRLPQMLKSEFGKGDVELSEYIRETIYKSVAYDKGITVKDLKQKIIAEQRSPDAIFKKYWKNLEV